MRRVDCDMRCGVKCDVKSGVGFSAKRRAGFGVKRGMAELDKVLWNGVGILMGLVVISGLSLATSGAKASPAPAAAAVTVTSSCELDATINQAHEAVLTASTYQSEIGKTTFTASCNDVNGYAVYAIGYTNTEWGRNDMLGAETGMTIGTGTATSGRTSTWAMRLTSVAGEVAPDIVTGYDSYHAVPAEYTKVASYDDSTMRDQEGSQFETTYAVYAASMQAPDTYTGKVKYTLVHPDDNENRPCTSTYIINYAANGGTGTMDSQVACADKQIAVLPSGFTPPTPVDEWQFGVWNTVADGSGYTYLPGQSVANLASGGGSVTLYAQWAPRYIQDLTASACSVMANENPLTVVDRRDGKDYTVRYLQGACWMTQNLRITGTVNRQYSNFSTYENVNVCEGDLTSGESYDQPRCHDSGGTSYGVWYNYAAVSAKTILTSSNSNNALEDICPSGWALPGYDTDGSAGTVNSMANMDSVGVRAFNPVGGGYYRGGSPTYDLGHWWSSVADGTVSRYGFQGRGSTATSLSTFGSNLWNSRREIGQYIRCVRTE